MVCYRYVYDVSNISNALTSKRTKGVKNEEAYEAIIMAFQTTGQQVNSLRPRQNGRHFADDIFNRISLNENVWIPIKISLKFVPKGPIDNIAALFQIMAWCRLGDKPLCEPRMVSLPTHICVTRPQWVNCSRASSRQQWIKHKSLHCWTFCERNVSLPVGFHSQRSNNPGRVFLPWNAHECKPTLERKHSPN